MTLTTLKCHGRWFSHMTRISCTFTLQLVATDPTGALVDPNANLGVTTVTSGGGSGGTVTTSAAAGLVQVPLLALTFTGLLSMLLVKL